QNCGQQVADLAVGNLLNTADNVLPKDFGSDRRPFDQLGWRDSVVQPNPLYNKLPLPLPLLHPPRQADDLAGNKRFFLLRCAFPKPCGDFSCLVRQGQFEIVPSLTACPYCCVSDEVCTLDSLSID